MSSKIKIPRISELDLCNLNIVSNNEVVRLLHVLNRVEPTQGCVLIAPLDVSSVVRMVIV